jgi:hypothetical protein
MRILSIWQALSEWSPYFTSLLLVLTVSLAATSPLPTKLIRNYFVAEFVGTVILEVCRHTVAFDSNLYRVLYCLALFPVRLLACIVAIKTSKWISIVMVPYAAALMWVALLEPISTIDQWIIIVDGVLVTYAGLSLCVIAPFIENKNIYGTLAILWVLLGLFDFGYVLQPYGKWAELNDSLLPVMVIGAFGWIALQTRVSGRLQNQSHI